MNTSGENLNFTRFLATHRPTAQALLKGSDAFPNLRGRVLLYPLNDRNTVLVSRFEGLPVGESVCGQRFFGSMSIVGVEAKTKKPVVSERKLRHDFMYGRREFCF